MKRVTQDDIILINEAYAACGTLTGAAKATGWSASTIKKYLVPGYKSEQKVEVADIKMPPIEEIADKLPPWYDLTCLTPEEEEEIKLLWKEMTV